MAESNQSEQGISNQEISQDPKTPLGMVSKATRIKLGDLRGEFSVFALEQPEIGEKRDLMFQDPDNLFFIKKNIPESSFNPFQRSYARYNSQKGGFEGSYDLTVGRDNQDPLNILRPVKIALMGEGGRETASLRFGGDDKRGAYLFVNSGNVHIKGEYDYAGRLIKYIFEDPDNNMGLDLSYDEGSGEYGDWLNNVSDEFSWHRDLKTGNLSVSYVRDGATDDVYIPTQIDLLQKREDMIPDVLLKNPLLENTEVDRGWKIDPLVALGGNWVRDEGREKPQVGE